MKTWPSPGTEVSDATPAGRGVIAVADMAKDEIAAIKADNIITPAAIEQATDNAGGMTMQIDDDFYLAPREADGAEDMSVFINHSCDPSVGFRGQVV